MRKTLPILVFVIFSLSLYGQKIITPNTGVQWTLDSLAAHFPGSVSQQGSHYFLTDSLEISAKDSLLVESAWILDSAVLVDVFGTLKVQAHPGQLLEINAMDSTKPYQGFRFEEFSHVSFEGAVIAFGGGLRVLTEDFHMKDCRVYYQSAGASTSGAISFSKGKPVVEHSTIADNYTTAFGSAANAECAPIIRNNYIARNNQDNTNRPQINLGPSGANDTVKVIGNFVEGDRSLDMVGGVGVTSLLGIDCNAIIDSNTVVDNRYGITMAGANVFGYMRHNTLESNNSQNDPMLGGSGISLNAATPSLHVIATGNEIRGNLWGITLIGKASMNLGDTAATNFNPGGNVFAENGNGGEEYALFNNTDLEVKAMNNCWIEDSNITAAVAEAVISHFNDDSSLGEVFYIPLGLCADTVGGGDTTAIAENIIRDLKVFPNPSKGTIQVDLDEPAEIFIYNSASALLRSFSVTGKGERIETGLPKGTYILKARVDNGIHSSTLLVE